MGRLSSILLIGGVLATLVVAGCGGGGGNGGDSPPPPPQGIKLTGNIQQRNPATGNLQPVANVKVTFGGYTGTSDFLGNYEIPLPLNTTVQDLYPDIGFYRFTIEAVGSEGAPPPPPIFTVVYPYPGGAEYPAESILGPFDVWLGDSTDMRTILIGGKDEQPPDHP